MLPANFHLYQSKLLSPHIAYQLPSFCSVRGPHKLSQNDKDYHKITNNEQYEIATKFPGTNNFKDKNKQKITKFILSVKPLTDTFVAGYFINEFIPKKEEMTIYPHKT